MAKKLSVRHNSTMVFVLGSSLVVLVALLIVSSQPTTAFDIETDCSGLAGRLDLNNATISITQYVTAGTNLTFPDDPESCTRPAQVVPVDICRIVMSVATSSRSSTRIEAWLPSQTNWTGRLLSTGNGGISGCIQYEDLAYGVSLGFATLGSNGGHDGMTGEAWLNNPDVVADFSWRSLHTTAQVARNVSTQAYSSPFTKSYYLGCSTGGRQGWKSVQSYPSDFDGAVVGAPALAFNNLTSWSSSFYPVFQSAGPEGFPPEATWPAVDANILAQCDTLDGATDNLIETASLCNAIYRPEALICDPTSNTSNTTTCITPLQASTIRSLFSPLYGTDGTEIFPALPATPGVASLAYSFYSASPFLYSVDWFRYAVYNNPTLNITTLTRTNWSDAWSLNAADVNTWSANLSAFKAAGAKVLHYHGQEDGIIAPSNSERYYDYVSREMRLPAHDLDDFYRFFRVSGMGHCGGGPGAWNIGNSRASLGPGEEGLTTQGNVLMALVKWVEDGVAPETIRGWKYRDDDTEGSGQGAEEGMEGKEVEYYRDHCRYPFRNVYGNGTWSCV
jgi:feruloyl esterase